MPTAIVTGANSGLGFCFAQKLIQEGYTVHAADKTLGDKIKTLQTPHQHKLDVSSPSSIHTFAQAFTSQPIDLLLNVAGIMAPPDQDALETISPSVLSQTFQTNTFGPLLLTQALLPSLLLSPNPRIGNVSSRVGSIGDNSTGGSYAYRASKAALNSISKSMAVDLGKDGVIVVVLHPGIVKTNILPGIHESEGAVEPEEAAEKLWGVLMSKGFEDSGRFWHREGQELEW